MLTTANQADLSKPGALQSECRAVPKTVSDAMTVTRSFGIRYLWVDALCILQDHAFDKSSEIDKMHQIYQSAALTIIAASDHDAHSGLLNMDISSSDENAEFVAGQRFVLDIPEMRDVTEFSTWFTRGWTLQELLCSRRVLFFTSRRTYYNCGAGNWSEDFPLDVSRDPNYFQYFRDDDPKLGFDSRNKSIFDLYSSMVEKISTRDFTNDSDVLNACRGLYLAMMNGQLGEVCCGLPMSYLEYALAWQPNGPLQKRGLSEYGLPFPSWSWAGWAGPIHYPFLSGPKAAQIQCIVLWSMYWPFRMPTSSSRKVSEPLSIYEMLTPSTLRSLSEDEMGPTSRWDSLPVILRPDSKWHGLIMEVGLGPAQEVPLDSWFRPGEQIALLAFRAKSIVCCIQATASPDASERNLTFFKILVDKNYIGQIHVDASSLHLAHIDAYLGSVVEIELISIFKLNFDSPGIKNALWINKYSRSKQFTEEFVDLVNSLDDKTMYAVMWIRWEHGVAYRIAVGYVTVEGFDAAKPTEKHIVLG